MSQRIRRGEPEKRKRGDLEEGESAPAKISRRPDSVVAALPPDVWWWLCPTVNAGPSFIGAAPQIRGIAPRILLHGQRWGGAATAHQAAKPRSLAVLLEPFLFAVLIHS